MKMSSAAFVVFYIFCFHVPSGHSYLWAYILGQPNAEGAYDHVHSHVTGDVNRTPWERVSNVSVHSNNSDVNDTQRWEPCWADRECGRGEFCDRHYGTCLPHAPPGAPCRRDGHCKRRLQCVHGRCRHPVVQPRPGARCKHDRECGPAGCCARTHGERLCQRRLVQDAACYVPPGGLGYTLNELCACVPGLVCLDSRPAIGHTSQQEANGRRNMDDLNQERSPREYLRCLPP